MKPSTILIAISFCFFMGAIFINVMTSDSNSPKDFSRASNNNEHAIDPIYKDIEFEISWSLSHEALINPYKMIIRENEIFVEDYKGNQPIAVYDTSGFFLKHLSSWGRGAGELNLGYSILGLFNKELLVFDDQTKRLLLLNKETGESLNEKKYNLHDPLLVRNKLLERAQIPFPNFAYGITLMENLEVSKDTLIFGNYEQLPELSSAKKNHLLKQGPWSVDALGNVYFAFHDSSLIIGFSPEGKVIFKSTLPYQRDNLPEFIAHRASPEPFSAPNRDEYPKQYISLSVDDNFIYGLYSGFQIKSRQDILKFNKLNEGNVLNIFDKKTSKYKFTTKLPVSFRDIYVSKDAIYGITIESKVRLIKINKPSIFK